ncbi:hypothetical protein DYI37_18555 [Fulvimarina endophytica]|uniref:Uncharacterized protein n=1 Tax=Fulvimarina endophytica TaxID=2293836 RepID=A0A371WY52_9HYPH|nr:hypothetical protein [Fulvimarina endophytica]RFC61930.1 hypothetical protein DYI37_18555 [Fulvimarina endophytica]
MRDDRSSQSEPETVAQAMPTVIADIGLDAHPATTLSSFLTLCHLTPFVLAARIPKLLAETMIYSPFDRDETRLAVAEKAEAVLEGTIAFQCQFAASTLAMQAAFVEGRFDPHDYLNGFGELASKTLGPAVERLQLNADRLA